VRAGIIVRAQRAFFVCGRPLKLDVRRTMASIRTLAKWAMSTLPGHIVLFQACVAVPGCVTGVVLNYRQGTLTPGWALYVAGVSVVAGLLVALAFWFTYTRPQLQRNRQCLSRAPRGSVDDGSV